LANLAQKRSFWIELKDARCFPAACVNKNVSLGIRGDANAFTEVQTCRQLQKIWNRVVGDVWCGCEGLGRRWHILLRPGHSGQKHEKHAPSESTLHFKPPYIRKRHRSRRT